MRTGDHLYHLRRRGALFALPALLLAAISAEAAAPGLPDGGKLYIEFGDVDRIRWDPQNDSPSAPNANDQIVLINDLADLGKSNNSTKCVLALNGTNTASSGLLSFNSDDGTIGFNSTKDQIGIREQKRGTDCGRVVPGQAIRLDLGTDLTGGSLKVVESTVGLTVKKNVVVDIAASVGGGTASHFTLRTGTAVILGDGNPPDGMSQADWNPSGLTNPTVYNCNPSSDSGSDNDASCIVPNLDATWDQLVLSVTSSSGEFAIGETSSEFTLAGITGDLICQETTFVAEDDTTGAFGQLRRLNNVDDPELPNCNTCVAIPYYLAWSGSELTFVADYLENTSTPQTCAAFEFTVHFPPKSTPARPVDQGANIAVEPPDFDQTTTGNISLAIEQQFNDDPVYYLDTCLGEPQYDASGILTGVDFSTSGAPPDMSSLDGTQYGCWLNLDLKYGLDADDPPDGKGELDQLWLEINGYLQGDWRLQY